MDFWRFHNDLQAHPGSVYHLLPAIAEACDLDDVGRAWLTWLNGNTQNPVTSLLLLDVSGGTPDGWEKAVSFWEQYRDQLQWDTDRRHQKFKFGEATEAFIRRYPDAGLQAWTNHGMVGWDQMWEWANTLPHMGRLSCWSMSEYAQILLGDDVIPDASSLLLRDAGGSRSHRTGLAVVAGHEDFDPITGEDRAPWWTWEQTGPMVEDLEDFGEQLAEEGKAFGGTLLTLESALCTYKSWHKPNRRYPNVYNDMAYERIRRGEAQWGTLFQVLWDAREKALPIWARLEDNPLDPGLCPAKQNHYLQTGQTVMMGRWDQTYWSEFDDKVDSGWFGIRKEKKW